MKVRPARREDYAALAELFASADEAVSGRSSPIDEEAVDGWLLTVALGTNTWLFEENETLVAAAFARLHRDGRGVSAGAVRPSARSRGLGTRLLRLTEARLVDEGARRIHAWSHAGDVAADELLARRGYREVRRFWTMAVELPDEPPEPAVPLEPFREEDAPAFHAALEAAFADHWEPHPEPFESWWERQRERSTYDPALWFLIRDGDEVVATIRNEIRASGGYVGALGVRRPWRGRGYGRALLLHSFREFRRRGMTRATLGVDAANPTGATRLYESAGMLVEQEDIVWEKTLAA